MADHGHGYRSSHPWLERVPVVTAPTAQELTIDTSLPDEFDWRNVNGRSFVTTDLNQHIPIYCGACWIHGTVHALNDRIKVMRDGRYPEVILSRQAIMNCVPDPSKQGPPPGCNGGDPWMIHKYLHEHKVPDDTCMPYVAMNMACEPTNVCRNCIGKPDPVTKLMQPDHCFDVPHYAGFGVGDYGNVSGEVAMMREIYARGPIVCSFATDDVFMYNYSENKGVQEEGVYKTNKVFTPDQIDHLMEVAGWGTTAAGTKYWVVRNSWGTYWGDMGWLKVQRGVNEMLMESECDWAVPDLSDLDEQLKSNVLGDYVRGTRNAGPRIGGTFDSEQPALPPVGWYWSAAGMALAIVGAASFTTGLFMARREVRYPWLQRGLLG